MKTLNRAFSILLTLITVFLVFLAYGSVNNRFYRVITVEGNSMSPTLWFGDLIVVTPPVKDIPTNAIVLMSVGGELVTHRLIGTDPVGKPITKGDANQVADDFTGKDVRIVGIERLRIPALGYPLMFLSSLFGKT